MMVRALTGMKGYPMHFSSWPGVGGYSVSHYLVSSWAMNDRVSQISGCISYGKM